MTLPPHTLSEDNYTILDWLNLHEISSDAVASILNMDCQPSAAESSQIQLGGSWQPKITADTAWELASHALAVQFPNLEEKIRKTQVQCKVNDEPVQQPYTHDNGRDEAPDIYLHYQGGASDLIDVAHEFSHATQLIAQTVDFVPPVLREIAAFLGELALLEHMKATQHPANAPLFSEWQRQNEFYLDSDVTALKDALQETATPYTYRQNYPLARILAFHLFHSADRARLTAIFEGEWTVMDCFNAVKHVTGETDVKNYFPEVPELDTERPAVDAYRSLGMMAYLDLDCRKGQSEKTIGEYYGTLVKHMQSRTSYVVIGEENKPIGYATWNVVEKDAAQIEITRQAAPFGDHLQVQRSLRKRLPDVKTAQALHERSARKEQKAW